MHGMEPNSCLISLVVLCMSIKADTAHVDWSGVEVLPHGLPDGIMHHSWKAPATPSGIELVPYDVWEEYITEWEDILDHEPSFDISTARLNLWHMESFNISANALTPQLYAQHDQCYGCHVQPNVFIPPNGSVTLLQSDFGHYLEIRTNQVICSDHVAALKERGEYWLIVFIDDTTLAPACNLVLANDPANYNLPILWAFLVFCGLAALWIIIVKLRKSVKRKHKSHNISDSTNVLPISVFNLERSLSIISKTIPEFVDDFAVTMIRKTSRRRSLDTFRGLSLLVVVFVNYGGGGYYFFDFAHWDGLFVADLVFPWFVWIMGVSIAFSFDAKLDKGIGKRQIFLKLLERDVKKFLIGLCLNAPSIQDMASVRIFGILQRLAMAHFFTASIHLAFVSRDGYTPKYSRCCRNKNHPMSDITDYWPEWVVMFTLLTTHVCITYLLQVPGCPTGYVGPGGLHMGGQFYNCTGGAAQYIDQLILGEQHMNPVSSTEGLYKSNMRYDSEGILGTLNVVFTCYLGVQAGKIITTYQHHRSRVLRWIVWAVLTGIIGAVLCKGSQFDGWVPINKNLWSVSFTMVLSCMAFLMLTILYLLIDVQHLWNGAPFVYPGINSIGIYILHLVFADYFPVMWEWPDYTQHWQRLFRGLWGCTIWTTVAYLMFVKKIFFVL